jgi:hypothetical protein
MSFATELLGRVAENRELARISGESSWQSGTETKLSHCAIEWAAFWFSMAQ